MLRSLGSKRLFSAQVFPRQASKTSGGGFGEAQRKQTGKRPAEDTAPYQNEYTRSGTHDQVSHSDEAYSRNTDPSKSRARTGEALESSGANPAASRAEQDDHKRRNSNTEASSYKKTDASSAKNAGGQNSASAQDASTSKFEKISKDPPTQHPDAERTRKGQ